MITLEILAAYLPFDVDTLTHSTFGDLRGKLTPQSLPNFLDGSTTAMLVLRPLSELYSRNYGYVDQSEFIYGIENKLIPVCIWNKLLADHYNVFGLKENEYIKK